MRVLKARERLERHAERQEELNDMIEQYRDMRAAIFSSGCIRYDKPHIEASPEDWITKKIIELSDFETKIRKAQTKYKHEAEELSQEIGRLESINEREVLTRHYLQHQSINDISTALNLNRTSVFRILRRGESRLDTF